MEPVTLTRDELKTLMSEAVESAFQRMGIDTDAPLDMQHDMAHLRKWRIAVEGAQTTTFKVVISTLVIGLLGALWLGVSTLLHKP